MIYKCGRKHGFVACSTFLDGYLSTALDSQESWKHILTKIRKELRFFIGSQNGSTKPKAHKDETKGGSSEGLTTI